MVIPTRHIFVYGSLRPDDDSGQPWTEDAIRGLKAEKAILKGARLFHDVYACAVLDDCQKHNSIELNDHQGINSDVGNSRSGCGVIHGYVLSTNDPELFQRKLNLFDQIEGYRGLNSSENLYNRSILDVNIIGAKGKNDRTDNSNGNSRERVVNAYVYHGTHRCSRENQIHSGDWLKRSRSR